MKLYFYGLAFLAVLGVVNFTQVFAQEDDGDEVLVAAAVPAAGGQVYIDSLKKNL